MAVQVLTHIELETNNPLEARIAGRGFKAYLVAGYAVGFSPEEAAEHYGITIGDVYAAMVFYHDNEEAIKQAIAEDRELGYSIGARDSKDIMAEIKARITKED